MMDSDPQTVKVAHINKSFLEFTDFCIFVERFVDYFVNNKKWPKVSANLSPDTLRYWIKVTFYDKLVGLTKLIVIFDVVENAVLMIYLKKWYSKISKCSKICANYPPWKVV